MRKIIAAINMTLDGFCDHTAVTADEETHQHYADLLNDASVILYGRITYQLMEYWRIIVENPTGVKAEDEFALNMDKIPKIVFSRTLESVDWNGTELKRDINKEEILQLRQQTGKDIFVGSPGLIAAFTNLGLIDEYQIAVHPVIAGSGLPLFKNIQEKVNLKLLKTKAFTCGAIILYYEPVRSKQR
ncbi:dihydrofolate reductase family protein [Dyadobacter sp. LJ53]|uniref:dihydrofolate reductase family protein n=1 Tax=Dyadobacter chenwenxiniae TaxID=2906456 RepID=UPI001F15D07E|nr:dihydrofolate reductase family protein [Dyadobacter chenwenxiniae]MCF0050408.1 dihydrofolate reductase family protein [Dyadobacter chenwenxiniae]